MPMGRIVRKAVWAIIAVSHRKTRHTRSALAFTPAEGPRRASRLQPTAAAHTGAPCASGPSTADPGVHRPQPPCARSKHTQEPRKLTFNASTLVCEQLWVQGFAETGRFLNKRAGHKGKDC